MLITNILPAIERFNFTVTLCESINCNIRLEMQAKTGKQASGMQIQNMPLSA
jgi:hypothetical protein